MSHLFDHTVELWGRDAQLDMVNEECGELLAALNRYRRGRPGLRELVAEIADVKIMLDQLLHIVDRAGYCAEMKNAKLVRLRRRVEEAEARRKAEGKAGGHPTPDRE